MNVEDRKFVTPFHILVYKPVDVEKTILTPAEMAKLVDESHMEAVQHEIHTIGDQRELGYKLMNGEYVEGPPLVIQYAELFALGCMELEPEVST